MKRIIGWIILFCLLFSLAVPGFAASAVFGDADGDGEISSADARLVLRLSVGLEKAGKTKAALLDVDADGDVTASDARLVLRRSVGLEKLFPAEMPFAPPKADVLLDIETDAPIALLYDVEDNRLLFEKNIDEETAPASLIKLLTTLTALKYCKPDTVFTVGDEIDLIAEDSSICPLEKGWKLTLKQLCCGMLVPSGNDAAYCVAANVAKSVKPQIKKSETAVKYFVSLMNKTAKELGMQDTVAVSPDGYDAEGQRTTARDLLTLARAALENDLIVTICGEASFTLTPSKKAGKQTWKNTNLFLNPENRFYDDRVCGLKGGFTDEAGWCLIALFKENGKRYLAIEMGAETIEARYELAKALMDEVNAFPQQPAG